MVCMEHGQILDTYGGMDDDDRGTSYVIAFDGWVLWEYPEGSRVVVLEMARHVTQGRNCRPPWLGGVPRPGSRRKRVFLQRRPQASCGPYQLRKIRERHPSRQPAGE